MRRAKLEMDLVTDGEKCVGSDGKYCVNLRTIPQPVNRNSLIDKGFGAPSAHKSNRSTKYLWRVERCSSIDPMMRQTDAERA